jgi:hypothetical protein
MDTFKSLSISYAFLFESVVVVVVSFVVVFSMLRNGGGAIGGGKGASSVVVVVAFMLFLLAYTTHSSGGEIQNEVTQKREKIFEFFAKKKFTGRQEISLVRRVVVVVVGCCCCCCCCECAVLLSLVGCSGRGEDLDRRAVRHTTRENTRVYKKKSSFQFLVVLGKEIIKDDASTATTNVQPSRARNDEENRFLLPRDGKDGERSSSERSR